MKKKNALFKLIAILFSKDFYKFLSFKTYAGYHRYLFLNKFRSRFPDSIIHEDVLIINPDQISIGKKCTLNKGCNLNCGYPPNIGSIRLGNEVIIGFNVCLFAGGGKISIADNVDIGLNAILTTQARSLKQNPVQDRENFEHVFGEISIGEGTFIAANSTILSGTSVGKFCNIIAGSVVQGTYPDFTTLAGNPARPLPRIAFK